MGYFDNVIRIEFEIGGFFGGTETYTINFKTKQASLYIRLKDKEIKKDLSDVKIRHIKNKLEKLNIQEWKDEYPSDILDGEGWSIDIEYKNGKNIQKYGHMSYPENFNKFKNIMKNAVK